jgi:hypothetical protein
MMNKTLTLTAACALLLCGCNSVADDEAVPDNFPADNVIRVTTQVGGNFETRASAYEEYTGQDFGFYIGPTVTNVPDFKYENVQYAQSNGEWLPADGSTLHWQASNIQYSYIAYAPWHEAIEDYDLPYDLSEEGGNYDLLWTSAIAVASALIDDNGKVNLKFEHIFCRFTVEVTLGNALYNNDYETNPLTAVTFTNSTGKGHFDLSLGELTQTALCVITPELGAYTAGSEVTDGTQVTLPAYMAPGEQEVKVTLSINGTPYTYTHAAYNYQAGKSYTLRIKVGESSVNGQGITVNDWSAGSESDLTTF